MAILSSGLVVPKLVHAHSTTHPTWDALLAEVGKHPATNTAGPPALKTWIRDLAMKPNQPQPALLLTGPGEKDVFHEAMRLLLPPQAVTYYPTMAAVRHGPRVLGNTWPTAFDRTWLVIVEGNADSYPWLFKHTQAHGRYLKYCLSHDWRCDYPIGHPLNNVQRFEVEAWTPQPLLLERLHDERDAFWHTLANYT